MLYPLSSASIAARRSARSRNSLYMSADFREVVIGLMSYRTQADLGHLRGM